MPDPRDKSQKKHDKFRVEGERTYYFIIRSLIAGTLFLIITSFTEIWQVNIVDLSVFFTSAFIELILWLFLIYFFTGITARILTFHILKYVFRWNSKSINTFWDINKGMNKMGIKWLISILIKSILFAFGIVGLLQNVIFDKSTFFTLVGTYVIVEVVVSLTLRLIFWRRG